MLAALDFSYWADEFINLEHGSKFRFKDHAYLIQPYQDDHPKQAHKKATQLGISTYSILRSIHDCAYRFPLGVIYFFPTDTDVSDFSKGRVNPLIKNNPHYIGKYMSDTDSVGLKKVGRAFIYFRGMKSKVGMKSVPADKVVFDEIDEATPEAMEMSRERLAHSQFQEEISLSNPTIPNYGIDALFQQSDQHFFVLKCEHCGEWNCVEELFPDCIIKERDLIYLGCKKCKKELNKQKGQWVAKYPKQKDLRGYQYSQLISPHVTAKDIWRKYTQALSTGRLGVFYNLTLGMAYVSAREKLEVNNVLSLCDQQFPQDPWKLSGPVFMGVDQNKGIHAVFMKPYKDKIITWFTEVQQFEELDQYMDKVTLCVIDALPETRKARELSQRFFGKVYLNYYVASKKGDTSWNEADCIVQENRTESMDASHLLFINKKIVLPSRAYDCVDEFAAQCANVAKKLEEDDETGSKRYVWVKLGPDHYRHAFNYCAIALNCTMPVAPIEDIEEDIESSLDMESSQFGMEEYL